jgi:hypothetical protein
VRVRPIRFWSACCALLLLAIACGGAKIQTKVAGTPEPDQPKFGYDANKYLGAGGHAAGTGAETRTSGSTTGGSGSPVQPRSNSIPTGGPSDIYGLGYNAFYYLNRTVPKIQIEIDAVKGYAPTRSAVDLLVQRLRSVADKPGGIQVLPYGTLPGQDEWSVDDLRKADQKYRNYHSSPDVAVIHILYVNGSSAEGALGVAFASGGCALFIQGIREGALPTVSAESVEKADIVHEVGHLLSLVNIGYTSPRDHEDPNHRGHSNNIESVMYWQIDNVGVFAVFRGLNRVPPTDFDADDRADLRDVKDRRLLVGN